MRNFFLIIIFLFTTNLSAQKCFDIIGPDASLIEKFGLTIIHKSHEFQGFFCGRVAEFDNEISLNT